MKRWLMVALVVASWGIYANTSSPIISSFESKTYSLKNKGIKDLVVDISSSRLTKEMNERKQFGNVEKVIFRLYWTANPERMDIEILGLPEGFREIKEELKISILNVLEGLLPPNLAQKFPGYKLTPSSVNNELVASDTSGIAVIPSYKLKFNEADQLIEVVGVKPIGSLVMNYSYEKTGFSDGKFVLVSSKTTSEEQGQSYVSERGYSYGTARGIGVLKRLKIENEHKSNTSGQKSVSNSEVVDFENYRIDSGEALKHFLSLGSSFKEAN